MRKVLNLILIFSFFNGYGQNIELNVGVDTTLFPSIKKPLEVWTKFLKTKDDEKGSIYWNKEEVERYGKTSYFLTENELYFGYDNYLKTISSGAFETKILSIRQFEEYYKIQSMLSVKNKAHTSPSTYLIFHVYAKETPDGWKLYNALPINSEKIFQSRNYGYLRYHFPKNHAFDTEKAKKQNDFILKICKDFDVSPDTVDYYFAPTAEQLQQVRGVDYMMGVNGVGIPTGRGGKIGDKYIIMSAGLDEYFPHELVHAFINQKYPDMHLWANEGLATYLGGSRGYELDWHLKRFKKYLNEHPEVDLDTMLNYINVDRYTDYRYVLGGFIIKLVYDKGGMELLDEFLKFGKTDDAYYCAIETCLGIKQADLNEFLRKELDE